MSSSLITAISSIIMALFTFFSSMIGIIESKPDTTIIQGFEAKSEDALRVMSFNIRCTNVGTDSWEDRIGIVSQILLQTLE